MVAQEPLLRPIKYLGPVILLHILEDVRRGWMDGQMDRLFVDDWSPCQRTSTQPRQIPTRYLLNEVRV